VDDKINAAAGTHSPPASCHVGYRSCFYRTVELKTGKLGFAETEKTFDPKQVYGDAPIPTRSDQGVKMARLSVPGDSSHYQCIDPPLGGVGRGEAMQLTKQRRHVGRDQAGLRP
jgi:hypothetical protein